MKLLKLITIVLIFVVAGCTDSLLDTKTLTDNALKSGHNNPLTFETEFDIWLDSRDEPSFTDGKMFISQTILGTAKVRHLGKTKVVIKETITIMDITVNPPQYLYPMKGVAEITFFAANGDQLVFNTTSDMYNHEYPIMNIETTSSTFIKGTGRFKNATEGTLHKNGRFNDDPEILAGTATYTVTVEFEKK